MPLESTAALQVAEKPDVFRAFSLKTNLFPQPVQGLCLKTGFFQRFVSPLAC
jgi:hypothetical protein